MSEIERTRTLESRRSSCRGGHLAIVLGFLWLPSNLSAQLTTTIVSVTVSSSNGVAAAVALCPADTWAVSGGVQPGVSNTDVLLISSAPYFETGTLFLQANGDAGRAIGWRGVVTNPGTTPQLVKVGVVCAPWPVTADVDSILVVTGGGTAVTCPSGKIAVGGGSEPALQNMSTQSSGPLWDVGGVEDLPAGTFYDAPTGWLASSTNPNGTNQVVKVATMCMSAPGAHTFYAETRANPGQVTFGLGCIHADEIMITAGFGVLGSFAVRVLWTSPHVVFSAMEQTIFGVPDGTYASANFWTRSLLYSGPLADDARLAGVCIPASLIFADGFESGYVSAWGTSVP